MILVPIIGQVQEMSLINMRKSVDEGFLSHRTIYAKWMDGFMID